MFFAGPLGRAKAVCATCTVTEACLAYALPDASLLGVWGGTTEAQRRRMRRSASTTDQVGQGATQTATVPTAAPVPSGSRYRGVRLMASGRYTARVAGITLGRYDTADEAAGACESMRDRLKQPWRS